MYSNFKNIYIVFILVGILLSPNCQKTVPVKEVISIHATSPSVNADGSSLDTVYADLSVNALASFRNITFQATSGIFSNGFDTMTVYANQTWIDPGKITALLTFRASLRSGPDTILASTQTVPQFTDFLVLNLIPSVADSIQLTPSTFVLKDTFGMQVTVMSILYNSVGGMVSQEEKVQFTDFTGIGTSAGGNFMPSIALLDSSKCMTTYFPKLLPQGATSGTYITILGTVLDSNGRSTNVMNSIKIYISP